MIMGNHNSKFIAQLKTVGVTPQQYDKMDKTRQQATLKAIKLEKGMCTCGRPRSKCHGHAHTAPEPKSSGRRDTDAIQFSGSRAGRQAARDADVATAKALGRGAAWALRKAFK